MVDDSGLGDAVRRRAEWRAAGLGRRAGRTLVRRLPPRIGRPLRDQAHRTLLRLGRGGVVPARAFEDFLVAQLEGMARQRGARLEGDYLEFGVYVGTSMGAAVRAFDRAGVARSRFVGFDSFQGLPPGSEQEGWPSGAFATSRSVAEWNLARQGVLHRVDLVEGWFDDTCTDRTVEELGLRNVVVAMIDCDTYSSTRVVLDFVEPLLAPHAVVVFDDWYARNPDGTALEGQRRAFEELTARRPGLMVTDAGRPGFFGQAFRVRQPAVSDVLRPPASPATLV